MDTSRNRGGTATNMKDLRKALRAFMLADSTISAAVGGQRIYASILPQGQTAPSIVQNLVSDSSDYNMVRRSGLGLARMQIDCWAQQPEDCVSLAGLVVDRLSGHRGVIAYGSSSPPDSVDVQAIFHDQGHDDYDTTARLHTRRHDFIIWFTQY